jgi:hypothetical protein
MAGSTAFAKELLRRALNRLLRKWFTTTPTPPPPKAVPRLSAPTLTVWGGIGCSAAPGHVLPNVTRCNGIVHKTISSYESLEVGAGGWINYTTACGLNVKHHPGLRKRTTGEMVTCLMCLAQ